MITATTVIALLFIGVRVFVLDWAIGTEVDQLDMGLEQVGLDVQSCHPRFQCGPACIKDVPKLVTSGMQACQCRCNARLSLWDESRVVSSQSL